MICKHTCAGDARGDVSIAFTCDPVNRHKLTDMALEEIDRLQAEVRSYEILLLNIQVFAQAHGHGTGGD